MGRSTDEACRLLEMGVTMSIMIQLAPELEASIQTMAAAHGVAVDQYVAQLVEQAERSERNAAARAVLASFLEGDAEEQRETWEAIQPGLRDPRLDLR